MQSDTIPRRATRARMMLSATRSLVPRPRVAVELGCGAGSLSRRFAAAFRGCKVIGVDADALALALARSERSPVSTRIEWIENDLRSVPWSALREEHGPFDVVFSAASIHWLSRAEAGALYRSLAAVMREGGLLMLADYFDVGGALGRAVRARREAADRRRWISEIWQDWYAAAERKKAFAGLLARREAAFARLPRHAEYLPAENHIEALVANGFSEAGIYWRHLDDTVVAAVR